MRKLDLEGEKFYNFTVIECAGQQNKRTMWKCVCDCGTEKLVYTQNLKRGKHKSCGCLQRPDLIGKKINYWEVLEKVGVNKKGQKLWLCRCKCGTEKIHHSGDIKRIQSCGCVRINKRPGTIYGVRNPGEDFVYIGQTIQNLKSRMSLHKKWREKQSPFQLWLKDNPNAEIIAIHENVPYDELNYLEQETIKKYDNLLNVCHN